MSRLGINRALRPLRYRLSVHDMVDLIDRAHARMIRELVELVVIDLPPRGRELPSRPRGRRRERS